MEEETPRKNTINTNRFIIKDDLKKILLTNVYRLNELSYEGFGTFNKWKKKTGNSKNSTTEENDEQDESVTQFNKSSDLTTAEGTVNCNHATFGTDGPSFAKTKAIFNEHPDYLFCYFSFKSPLFIYSVDGYPSEEPYMGRYSFYCEEIRWKPKSFVFEIADYFSKMIGLHENFLIEFMIAHYDEQEFITRGQDNTISQLSLPADAFISSLATTASNQFAILKTINEAKRYFLYEQMKFLCQKTEKELINGQTMVYPPIYKEEMIVQMEWDDICSLYNILTTTPHVLAFHELMRFKYRATEEMKENNPTLASDYIPLPEITYATLQWIVYNLFPDITKKTDKTRICSVCIYENLKKECFENKHMYVPKNILFEMSDSQAFDERTKMDAITFLIDNKIVELSAGEDVYIRYVYYWERCIAISVDLLYERHAFEYNNGIDQLNIPIANLKTFGGYTICDEQEAALKKFLESPLVLVNGRPGSGKTDMLGIMAKSIPLNKIIATAIKGINVSKLNKIFPGRAFTAHKLLYFHDTNCKRSPHYKGSNESDQKNKTKNVDEEDPIQDSDQEEEERKKRKASKKKYNKEEEREKLSSRRTNRANDNDDDDGVNVENSLNLKFKECPFEDVEYVYEEECSNWDAATFSKLISALVCCGNLRKVFLLGDSNQLPSIRCGNIIKEFTIFCREMETLCEFVHNHRSGKAAKILNQNIEALLRKDVRQMKFDDECCIHIDVSGGRADKLLSVNYSVLGTLKKYKLKEYDHHVITRTNAYKDSMGLVVERYYHDLDKFHTEEWKKYGFWVNRKISFTQNNYKERIMNNEILILTSIEDRIYQPSGSVSRSVQKHNTAERMERGAKRFLSFRNLDGANNIIIEWKDWTRKHLRRASASTIEVAQGSEFDDVLFVLPYASQYDTFESVLTAWTRPTKRLFFFGNLQDLAKAIMRHEPARRSHLKDFLLEFCRKYKYQVASLKRNDQQLIQTILKPFSDPVSKLANPLQKTNTNNNSIFDALFMSTTDILASLVKPKASPSKNNASVSVIESKTIKDDGKKTEPASKQITTPSIPTNENVAVFMKAVADAEIGFIKILLNCAEKLAGTDSRSSNLIKETLNYFTNDDVIKPLLHSRAQMYQQNVSQQIYEKEEKGKKDKKKEEEKNKKKPAKTNSKKDNDSDDEEDDEESNGKKSPNKKKKISKEDANDNEASKKNKKEKKKKEDSDDEEDDDDDEKEKKNKKSNKDKKKNDEEKTPKKKKDDDVKTPKKKKKDEEEDEEEDAGERKTPKKKKKTEDESEDNGKSKSKPKDKRKKDEDDESDEESSKKGKKKHKKSKKNSSDDEDD